LFRHCITLEGRRNAGDTGAPRSRLSGNQCRAPPKRSAPLDRSLRAGITSLANTFQSVIDLASQFMSYCDMALLISILRNGGPAPTCDVARVSVVIARRFSALGYQGLPALVPFLSAA
jgi:hypothetical protein